MIRRLILFIFVAATFVSTEPVRRRRQSSDSPSSIPLPCPINCGWKSSMSWAKAISFDTPTINMVEDPAIVNASDPFSLMCAIYRDYQKCMGGCPVSTDTDRQAVSASPSYDQVCTSRQADFDKALPCLTDKRSLFKSTCQKVSEDLLAATTRMQSGNQWTPNQISTLCEDSNRQLYCIFPIVRQTCGDDAYNLIRLINSASMAGIQAYVPKDIIANLYPTCNAYFSTLANGISLSQTPTQAQTETVSTSVPSTTVGSTTTATSFNTTTVTSTTPARLRDDPIPFGEGMGLSGTNPPSTTPSSSASKINFSNFMAFFVFSMLLW